MAALFRVARTTEDRAHAAAVARMRARRAAGVPVPVLRFSHALTRLR